MKHALIVLLAVLLVVSRDIKQEKQIKELQIELEKYQTLLDEKNKELDVWYSAKVKRGTLTYIWVCKNFNTAIRHARKIEGGKANWLVAFSAEDGMWTDTTCDADLITKYINHDSKGGSY